MANGGARPGAGRPRGVLNTKTQDVVAKALAGGITPIEVIINGMRYHDEKFKFFIDKAQELESEKAEPDVVLTSVRHAEEHLVTAVDFASKASPYAHPKLASVAHTGPDGKGPVQTMDLTKLDGEQLRALEGIYGSLTTALPDDGDDTGGEGTPGDPGDESEV